MVAGQWMGVLRDAVLGIVNGAGISLGLKELLRHSLSERGRALHGSSEFVWSALPLVMCEMCGGDWQKTSPAAAAIELWLAAGDVFDDVEDHDGAGLWQTAGLGQAVNAGTALLFLSQAAMMRLRESGFPGPTILRAMGELCRSGAQACCGQHDDLEFEEMTGVGEDEYLKMTGMRSGSLISCACRVGAILGTGDEAMIDACGEAGFNLGVYSQISNDVRSLRLAGLKSDVRRKKKTLPVIYGLQQCEGEARRFLRSTLEGGGPIDTSTENMVRQVLEECGAMTYSLMLADIYKQRAFRALEYGGIDSAGILRLQKLLA